MIFVNALHSQKKLDSDVCIPDVVSFELNKVWIYSNNWTVRASDTFSVDGIVFHKIYVNSSFTDFSFSNEINKKIFYVNEKGEKGIFISDEETPDFFIDSQGVKIIIADYHATLRTPVCEYNDLIALKIDTYVEYYKKGIGFVAATISGKLDYYLKEIRYNK